MLEHFCIVSKKGIVLWSKHWGPALKGDPIDNLISTVLLQERNSENTFYCQSYALKWTFANELGLIFVAVFQKIFHLMYVDALLDNVRKDFIELFRGSNLDRSKRFDFDEQFDKLLREAEQMNPTKKVLFNSASSVTEKNSIKAVSPSYSGDKGEKEEVEEENSKKNNSESMKTKASSFSSSQVEKTEQEKNENDDNNEGLTPEEIIARNIEKLKNRGKAPAPIKVKSKSEPKVPVKQARTWSDKVTKKDGATLEISKQTDLTEAQEEEERKRLMGNVENYNINKEWETSTSTTTNSTTTTTNSASASSTTSAPSRVFGFFKGLVGNKELTEADLTPILDKIHNHLIEKNVAEDISKKCCDSICASLVGKTNPSFTSVASTVHAAMEEALTRILTPKRAYDILSDVRATNKQQRRPYSIVFVGVNGVGKSTSLSKVCFWLLQSGLKVLIAGCDTFRAGAVEQLRVHARCLKVDLFEQGYGKDASQVAGFALSHAKAEGYDVVLIDTAGRMDNNEPLMRSLAKLVGENKPDLILFVGEALVGNSGVHQLTEFNASLRKYQHGTENPRIVDGIFLTKFDTIDEKVGAALSMTYTTGQPILFVGVGQTYTDLRRLNVTSVVKSLLK